MREKYFLKNFRSTGLKKIYISLKKEIILTDESANKFRKSVKNSNEILIEGFNMGEYKNTLENCLGEIDSTKAFQKEEKVFADELQEKKKKGETEGY